MNLNSSDVSPSLLSRSSSKLKEVIVDNTKIHFFSKKLGFVKELMSRQKKVLRVLFDSQLATFVDHLFDFGLGQRDVLKELLAIGNKGADVKKQNALFPVLNEAARKSLMFKKVESVY